jgi:NADH-quinone oxidoreductase subunit C
MEPLEIVERLKEKYFSEIVDVTQFREQVFVSVKSDRITDICRYLHDEPDIHMDFLADICGVDYPGRKYRFEVLYNLYSIKFRHRLIVKALLTEEAPNIKSVVPIWNGANCHEREACDMYGIIFHGHPDLRRILMPEDWEGFPQRKDYPLKGREDWEYKGFEECKELHNHDKEWNIQAS